MVVAVVGSVVVPPVENHKTPAGWFAKKSHHWRGKLAVVAAKEGTRGLRLRLL